MRVIAAHRERVARLELTMSRLLELEGLLQDIRSKSWELQSHFSTATEAEIQAAHRQIYDYEQEIAMLSETLVPKPSKTGAPGP